MRIARRAAAAALGLAAPLLIVTAGAAAAAPAGPEAGYWWQPEPVSGLIPVPGVPSDGLYVASSPTGPQAESAVRIGVPAATSYVRLTLHVSPQERVGRATVIAYPATSRWQTGGPQAWSARPSYRASATPVRGVFIQNGNAMTLTFPAHEAASGLVLVPDPNPPNRTFTIAFSPPRAADVTFRSAPTRSPSAAPSHGSPSHRPTHTPRVRHPSALPSARHTRQSHSPEPSTVPSKHRHHRRSPSPMPTPTPTASPAPGAASASGHAGRDALLGASCAVAALLVGFALYRAGAARRSPPDEG